jgi:hypothetical protein
LDDQSTPGSDSSTRALSLLLMLLILRVQDAAEKALEAERESLLAASRASWMEKEGERKPEGL